MHIHIHRSSGIDRSDIPTCIAAIPIEHRRCNASYPVRPELVAAEHCSVLVSPIVNHTVRVLLPINTVKTQNITVAGIPALDF